MCRQDGRGGERRRGGGGQGVGGGGAGCGRGGNLTVYFKKSYSYDLLLNFRGFFDLPLIQFKLIFATKF